MLQLGLGTYSSSKTDLVEITTFILPNPLAIFILFGFLSAFDTATLFFLKYFPHLTSKKPQTLKFPPIFTGRPVVFADSFLVEMP